MPRCIFILPLSYPASQIFVAHSIDRDTLEMKLKHKWLVVVYSKTKEETELSPPPPLPPPPRLPRIDCCKCFGVRPEGFGSAVRLEQCLRKWIIELLVPWQNK